MRVIRVFPRRTKATPRDELAFVGEPPLPSFVPPADEVHVSVTFTWDVAEGERLARAWGQHYPRVRLGGPAITNTPWAERCGPFVPGLYLKPGYVITSRGCPNHCGFCLVPEREGRIREFDEIPGGHIVLDNNLLACSDAHIDRVLRMLADQRRAAVFSGGLDAERMLALSGNDIYERWRDVRIRELWLAYDSPEYWPVVEKAIRHCAYWFRLSNCRRLRVYVLGGFGSDTPEEAEGRCEQVMEAGGLPFLMLYQPADWFIEYGRDWKAAQRKWTRPAAMLATNKIPLAERRAGSEQSRL